MAGRIPQSFIQDLLARTDIVQVIGERLQLKRAGKEFVALSPFTNEKTPSFTVSPQKQFYHCFSSGKHGTAITFLMEYDRLSFVEAVEELARRAGLAVPREGGAAAAPVLEGPLDALAAAERVYRAELRRADRAVAYLKERGVTGETAKRFGIGFAPDAWDTLARQFPDPEHAVTAGLLVRKDGGRVYDFFRNRIMFPVRDLRGRVITFGGRVLPGGDDPRKYLNGRDTPLFHKGRNLYGLYEARQGGGDLSEIVVVEGYMDAVMLAQHGITNAVATLGTATTRDHLNLLFKVVPRVVFCFDGDAAGSAAAWRALEQALPELHEGRECAFMFLPKNRDPDDLVREIGADAFRERVAAARPLPDFLLGELRRKADPATTQGRARLAGLARPHLARMRHGPLRTLLVRELERLTRLTAEDLEAAPSSRRSGAAAPAPGAAAAAAPVRRALQLLLERPALAGAVEAPERLAGVPVAGAALLARALRFFREQPGATAARLLEGWRESAEGELVNRLAASPVDLDENALESEFLEQINKLQDRLQRGSLRERVNSILAIAQERPLTAEEQAEVESLKSQLSRRKAV